MVRTSWSTDPLALGSYSYLPTGAAPAMRRALRAPVDGRLFFAGEACSSEAPSTVHGALESGTNAADAVIATDAIDTVVVVGAGIAGLAAAARLKSQGLDVVVVEARDRIGGRIDTVRPTGWPIPVERGASWVHDVAASDLPDRLRRAAITTVPFDYDSATLDAASGRRVDATAELDRAAARVEKAIEWASDRDADVSLASAITHVDASHVDDPWIDWYIDTEIVTEYGAEPGELSAQFGLEEGTEGDDLLVIGGYSGLAATLAKGIDLRLGKKATQIERSADGARVVTASGEHFAADAVVVTVPLGVLKASAISFVPALPAAHATAIAGLGMGLLDKFWFRFDSPFWRSDALMWTRVGGSNPFREWFNLQAVTDQPVLLALLGGDAARTAATLSDATITDLAMASLHDFTAAGW